MWSKILCEFLVFPFMYDETKPSYKFLNSYRYVILYFCIPFYTSGTNRRKYNFIIKGHIIILNT